MSVCVCVCVCECVCVCVCECVFVCLYMCLCVVLGHNDLMVDTCVCTYMCMGKFSRIGSKQSDSLSSSVTVLIN